MAGKNRRENVAAEMADALLNVPHEEGGSIGEWLAEARQNLIDAVQAANAALEQNPLCEILAEHEARKRDLPGASSIHIFVDDLGNVLMETPEEGQRTWKSALPPIADLREEAEQLGIDPAPFGKSKKKLIKAIEAAKAGKKPAAPAPKPAPAPKKAEPTPAPAPAAPVAAPEQVAHTARLPVPRKKPAKPAPRVVPDESRVVSPWDDDEVDLDALFSDTPAEKPAAPQKESKPAPAPEQPAPKTPAPKGKPRKARPPRLGTPGSSTTAKKKARPSLANLVQNADKLVDLDAIMSKKIDPPKPEDAAE